jgi:hypothetical protein
MIYGLEDKKTILNMPETIIKGRLFATLQSKV